VKDVAVKPKKRFEVFKRDKFTCVYCGRKPPEVVLELEHIRARANGGSDEYENLATSCFECNRGKGANDLEAKDCDNVAELQLETIAQLTAFNEMLFDAMEKRNSHIGRVIRHLVGAWGWDSWDDDDTPSLRRFMQSLTVADICDAADIAAASGSPYRQWKYCCGVCWKKIKGDYHAAK
jgi:hypothetical protein